MYIKHLADKPRSKAIAFSETCSCLPLKYFEMPNDFIY